MATNTDKFLKAANNWVGSIGSGAVSDGTTTTIPLVSVTGLPTDTAVQVTIDRVDTNGASTPAKMEVVTGVVSSSNLENCLRGVEGTAQAHSAGAIVEVMLTAAQWNSTLEGILVDHAQDGTHFKVMSALNPVGTIREFNVATNPADLLGFGTWDSFGAGQVTIGLDSGDSDFDTVGNTGGEKTHKLVIAEMPSHTHTQNSHNHTQNAHNHTQNSHNHTQNSHNHDQNAHSHTIGYNDSANDTSGSGNDFYRNVSHNATTSSVTATNKATTATNNATTATNKATTATNQATTATNQNTGGNGSHNNLQPYIVVYRWVRTA